MSVRRAKNKFISSRPRQQGAVLVVSLVILLAMTLIGVTALQNSMLEERMAGNLKDHNLAFQGSEAGLSVAQEWLDELTNAPRADDSGSNGIWSECTVGERDPDAIPDCTPYTAPDQDWFDTAGNYLDYTSAGLTEDPDDQGEDPDDQGEDPLEGVSSQPKLVFEQHYVPPLDFEKQAKGAGVHHYTATSMGYGGTANAKSLLQVTVQKVYVW